ncbi:MAG: hypothetical protein J6Y20_10985 [Lachnospiraceae bacterium]|nr:hypothetical protein [Lachnospiraceae bacterium]
MAKPNWSKIKREYITSDIGMRPLAEKHNISFNTLKKHAVSEQWALAREQHQMTVAKKAVKKYNERATKEATELADEATLLLEGATLAINWLVKRLNSDEVSDWREVEGLIRAMNGAKALTKIKMALEEQEQRARIANLEKQTEVADREPVQIDYSRIAEEDMT